MMITAARASRPRCALPPRSRCCSPALDRHALRTAKVKAVISEQVKTEEAAKASQKRVEQLDEETTQDARRLSPDARRGEEPQGYNEQLAVQVNRRDADRRR